MKKINLFFAVLCGLCFAFQAEAQDTLVDQFYISGQANFLSPIGINTSLVETGQKPMSHFLPGIGIGELIRHNKFLYRSELFAFFNGRKSPDFSYNMRGISISINPQYQVLKLGKSGLFAGLALDYRAVFLNLSSGNDTVNFSSGINPANHQGLIELYNHAFLLGPTLSTGDIYLGPGFSFSLALSYEFDVIRGRWKSQYATVLNAPKAKTNQLKFSLLIPFYTHLKTK